MGSIGPPEILVILLVALLVLGPDRLPEAARQVGRVVAEMRRITTNVQTEVRDAINGSTQPPSPSVRQNDPASRGST